MDTFQSLSKKSLFAFGGPNNFKSKPIQASRIIKQTILDGNYIHSCIDYDGHLQFVKEVALHNGKINNFVPKNVIQMFKKKLKGSNV